jgi:hypothetical protein
LGRNESISNLVTFLVVVMVKTVFPTGAAVLSHLVHVNNS